MWRDFQCSELTLCARNRDYGEWHKGRTEYAVWTIDLHNESIRSRFESARAHLSGFLLARYRRQPHVTVFVCGFPAESERFNDDYSFRKLERHLQALRTQELSPFEIKIGGINSFSSAPFLEVYDDSGGIERIRALLAKTHTEVRMDPYVPHVTLGLYADHYEAAVMEERICSFGASSPIPHLVDQIHLSTYAACEIAGPLTAKHKVDFDSG